MIGVQSVANAFSKALNKFTFKKSSISKIDCMNDDPSTNITPKVKTEVKFRSENGNLNFEKNGKPISIKKFKTKVGHKSSNSLFKGFSSVYLSLIYRE